MNTSRWVHLAGVVVVVVSLIFVGQRLWAQAAGARIWDVGAALLLATIIGSLIYAAACLLLVRGWCVLIHLFGDTAVPFWVAASLYARSQIAKYVPGNVLHLAARHAWGRRIGLSHAALGLAALGEMAGLTLAASALAVFAAGATRAGIASWWIVGVAVGAAVVVLALPAIWRLIARWHAGLPLLSSRNLRRTLAAVLVSYMSFFVLAGTVLVLLVSASTGGIALREAAASLFVFAIAWIAGFLMPGAPAGIGVREAVVVLALEDLGHGSQSIVIALLFRLATVGGDLLFFLALMAVGGHKLRELPSQSDAEGSVR